MNHNKASSYWTQRRIIRENVAQHINSIIGEYVCSEGQDSETESTVTSETFEQHHVTSMDVCMDLMAIQMKLFRLYLSQLLVSLMTM